MLNWHFLLYFFYDALSLFFSLKLSSYGPRQSTFVQVYHHVYQSLNIISAGILYFVVSIQTWKFDITVKVCILFIRYVISRLILVPFAFPEINHMDDWRFIFKSHQKIIRSYVSVKKSCLMQQLNSINYLQANN